MLTNGTPTKMAVLLSSACGRRNSSTCGPDALAWSPPTGLPDRRLLRLTNEMALDGVNDEVGRDVTDALRGVT
jgi:hypothetical protein